MTIMQKLMNKPELGKLLLVEIRPSREYIDGKPADEISGYKYICVVPTCAFERFSVKIMGAQKMDEPVEPIEVDFDSLTATAYTDGNNRPALSFKAENIRVISRNKTQNN